MPVDPPVMQGPCASPGGAEQGLAIAAQSQAGRGARPGWRALLRPWLRPALRALQRLLDEPAGPPADPALLHALQRNEQQLRLAEQVAHLGSFDWDPRSGALHWSDQHYRLWGLAPGAVVPTLAVFRQGVHPDDLATVDRALQQALQPGGDSYALQHRVVRPDGSVRHIQGRGQVLHDAQGQAVRMIGTVQDVTAQHEAQALLHRFEFVLNTIADPVSVIDEHLRYRLVNDAWCQSTGLTRAEVVDQPVPAALKSLMTTERVAAFRRCLAERSTQVVLARLPMHRDATTLHWWETTMYPYHALSDGRRAAVLITRNVSARHDAQAALAASVDNLRLTLNATGDGIFASDARAPDEPLLFVNDRLLQIWQIPAEQAATLTPAGVLTAACRFFVEPARELAQIRDIIASGQMHERRVTLNDGRVLLRRCVPTMAEQRQVRVWSFRDITAEAHALADLRDAESRQRDLLDAFPGYIACIDDTLRYTTVNARLAELVQRPAHEIVGRTVRELVGPDWAERIEGYTRRALAGEVVQHERHYPAQPGRPARHVLITLTPAVLRADGRRNCYAFGTDITPLKQTEEALVQARDEAERANRAKSAFLSSMSHELRTPMNAVLGFAQLLASSGGLAERQRAQLREIRRGGQHLLALINDLLDLARIESGRMELHIEPVAVHAVAAEVVSLMAVAAAQRGLRVSLPEREADRLVLADRTRLRQVLLNLLGNAVKYNHEGGWVRLDWAAQGDQVMITVHDSGPGLDAAQQARLFQPFERLGADRQGTEGTGIGLALCRHLVALMHGRIGVDSTPGQGSRFWFSLAGGGGVPLLPPPAGGAASGLPLPPATGTAAPLPPGRTVLYIEDNPVNAMLMVAVLEALPGVRTLVATSAEAGLGIASREALDLVLVDIQLPGMDGYQVLQRLRALPRTQAVPVLAVSANAMAQDVARGHAAGFAAYLTKPLDLPVLLQTVSAGLGLPMPDWPAAD